MGNFARRRLTWKTTIGPHPGRGTWRSRRVPGYDHGNTAYVPESGNPLYDSLKKQHRLWGSYVRLPKGETTLPQTTMIFDDDVRATYTIPLHLEANAVDKIRIGNRIVDVPQITRTVFEGGRTHHSPVRDREEIQRILEANRAVLLELREELINPPRGRRMEGDDIRLRNGIDHFLTRTSHLHPRQMELPLPRQHAVGIPKVAPSSAHMY